MLDLRARIINHVFTMKNLDPDYARYALQQYATQLPDLDLMQGVRDALKAAA